MDDETDCEGEPGGSGMSILDNVTAVMRSVGIGDTTVQIETGAFVERMKESGALDSREQENGDRHPIRRQLSVDFLESDQIKLI